MGLGENSIAPFLRLAKYSQFPAVGCSAAWIAALPGLSIGPGGRPLFR